MEAAGHKRQPLAAHVATAASLGQRILLRGSADAEDRHPESDHLPAASAGRSPAPPSASAGPTSAPDTGKAPAGGSALAPASAGAPGGEYLVWSSDGEEESETATEEEPETATIVVKEGVRQETDAEDENVASEEGEKLDAWAGCVTPTRNTSRLYHAQSGAKDKRPQKGSAASHSDDKGSDSDDDAEGVSSGHVSSGSDDMSPCAYVNESECYPPF